jgi:hypothetical protein
MAEGPIPADAAHAMQTVTRYQQEDRAERGRFGRDVLAPATEDVQMADARKTMQSEHADDFESGGYEIDADAVADAIIARLMAGRTLHRHPADEQ